MKIILRESYESLGHPGDIVEVRGGYARNYLVPQGIAYPANRFYLRMFEQEREELLKRDAIARAKAESVAGQAAGVKIEFIVKMGDRGKMHGAITNADIAAKLEEKGISIDRRKIPLPAPIKSLGEFNILVKLHADVVFEVGVTVIPEPSLDEDEEEMDEALEAAAEEASADSPEIVELEPAVSTDATADSVDASSSVEIVDIVEAKPETSDDDKDDDK